MPNQAERINTIRNKWSNAVMTWIFIIKQECSIKNRAILYNFCKTVSRTAD